MPSNDRNGKPEEIQEIVEALKKTSEPIAKEMEQRLIQLCSCAAAIWNLAGSTDPIYLRHYIATVKDTEQKKKIISENLSKVSDFAGNIEKSCIIGSPIIDSYLKEAKSAYESNNFEGYINSLQEMHMALGKALGTCYGAIS